MNMKFKKEQLFIFKAQIVMMSHKRELCWEEWDCVVRSKKKKKNYNVSSLYCGQTADAGVLLQRDASTAHPSSIKGPAYIGINAKCKQRNNRLTLW